MPDQSWDNEPKLWTTQYPNLHKHSCNFKKSFLHPCCLLWDENLFSSVKQTLQMLWQFSHFCLRRLSDLLARLANHWRTTLCQSPSQQISNTGQPGCKCMLWVTLTTNLCRPLLFMTFLISQDCSTAPPGSEDAFPSCPSVATSSITKPVSWSMLALMEPTFKPPCCKSSTSPCRYTSATALFCSPPLWDSLCGTTKTSVFIAHPSSMLHFNISWWSVIFNTHNQVFAETQCGSTANGTSAGCSNRAST